MKKNYFSEASVYKFYDRWIQFDRLWKWWGTIVDGGVVKGDPREITRGSKWKIPGNSLKTTQNILWLLLVLFFCSGCYILPPKIAFPSSPPLFFSCCFYDTRSFRLTFSLTILWRFHRVDKKFTGPLVVENW